jgi:N-acetylmuramoyl-L-alanine amidase
MKPLINDAGHGGNDPGATSNGNIEKEYTLEAALYVQKRLKELGFDNDVTRSEDITLSNAERTNKVKQYKYCISHHFNAGGGSGVEVIHSIYADGQFEHDIINNFRDAGYPVRPTPVYFKNNSKGQDYYFMHRETGPCRVTIVEYDFVDGPQSEKIKDKAYREGMYECVIKAICKRHGAEYRPKATDEYKANVLYKVQVGAFTIRENAEKLLDELKEKGFNGFITTEERKEVSKPKTNKSKYYKIGDAHIIETTPDNIEIAILGDTLNNAKRVGVNGTFFDTKTAPVANPESCVFIAMNDGKALSNNAQFNGWNAPPRATLIYHTNKQLGFRQLQNINTIRNNTIWAIGGYMVKPYIDFGNERIPDSINYKTAHTYIGYDAEDKIYLIVKPNHMIYEIVPLLNELGITNCIALDGGGSSQLNHPQGHFRSDRRINTAIVLKEV